MKYKEITILKVKEIKDCDGNLLYRKLVTETHHHTHDETLVGEWKEDTGIDNILRKIDNNFPDGSINWNRLPPGKENMSLDIFPPTDKTLSFAFSNFE